MTWSHNRDPDFFWPLKFLPSEPDINEARILTFGYNSSFRPGSGRNKMSVLDFAKDLLYDLKYSQDESVPGLEDLRMGEVRHRPGFSRRASRKTANVSHGTATHHIHRPFHGRVDCERGVLLKAVRNPTICTKPSCP